MKRGLAFALVMLFVFAACGNGKQPDSVSEGRTLQQLADATLQTYSVVTGNSEFLPGKNRLVFAMLDQSQNLVRDLKVDVYLAKTTASKAIGPVKATFEDDGLADRAFYRAEIDLESEGKWFLLMRQSGGDAEKPNGAGTTIDVVASTQTPKAGDKAIPVTTPTVADHRGVDPICTREPNDPMHDLSLDAAIANGKPTVVVFSTPALCTSRVCGPVVDQVLRVRDGYTEKANFVHVEVFTDRTGKAFTEGMKTWKLQTEPWTYVIDGAGTIRASFEGPVTTGEIEEALKGVL